MAKNNFIAHIIRKLLNTEMCEYCECANIKPTLPKFKNIMCVGRGKYICERDKVCIRVGKSYVL